MKKIFKNTDQIKSYIGIKDFKMSLSVCFTNCSFHSCDVYIVTGCLVKPAGM